MLRLKEARQKRVGLQQSFAGQTNLIRSQFGKAFLNQRTKAIAKFVANVNIELPAEVIDVELAGFQLQDQLANEPLMIGNRKRAVQRKLTGVEFGDVLFP